MTTGNHIKEIKIVIYYINFNLLTRLKCPLKHHSPKFPILTLPACKHTITPNTYPSANTSKLPSQMYFQNELLIRQRILYKTLLLTHKAVRHISTSYLTNLIPLQRIPLQRTTTNSRLINTFLIELLSKYKQTSTNIRSWSTSAPYSWNTIPRKLQVHFKSFIKTYLIKIGQ